MRKAFIFGLLLSLTSACSTIQRRFVEGVYYDKAGKLVQSKCTLQNEVNFFYTRFSISDCAPEYVQKVSE